MLMDDIFEKLSKISDNISYDSYNSIITLIESGITAYIDDLGSPAVKFEFEDRKYSYSFVSSERLYEFLEGVLKGKITFRSVDEKNIVIEGFEKKPETSKSRNILRAVINTVIGIPVALFGIFLSIFGILLFTDLSSPTLLYDLCPLPIALGTAIIGISMIHHGWTKKPLPAVGAFLFGLGTAMVSFVLSVTMATYSTINDDDKLSDIIGVSVVYVLLLAIGCICLVCGLIQKNSPIANLFILTRTPHELKDEEITLLIKNIMERSRKECIRISLAENKSPSIFDSKIGGLPYWGFDVPYPASEDGAKMFFLAQFDLARLPETSLLPKEGMLQFFIDIECDECRVIHHKNINRSITEDRIRELDLPTVDDSALFPIEGECGLDFEYKEAHVSLSDTASGTALILQAASELGFHVESDITLDELVNDDEYDEDSCHLLLGYPKFTQFDPRENDSRYDTLLFQLDSDKNWDITIRWGDWGVGNFFINGDDLKNGNFSDVFFTWDCY